MKMKIGRNLLIVFFLIGMLVATCIYEFYLPQIAKVKSELEDPLEAWSEASYIIWKYNSTYTAYRNMSTLFAEDLTDNASYIFQTVIDVTTITNSYNQKGGLIFVKRGTYEMSSTVTLKDYISIMGEGIDVTILHYTGEGSLFIIQNATNVRISDLTIEGD